MQVNQAFSELRVMNDQPVLRPPSTQKWPVEPKGSSVGNLPPQTVVHGGPVRQPESFGNLLGNVGGTLPPTLLPPSTGNLLGNVGGTLPPTLKPPVVGGNLLGDVGGTLPPTPKPPAAGDHLELQVRDYRESLSAVHADLVSQLKSAQDTLKQARQSGDQDAITAAQKSIDDLNVQLKANHDSLSAVHDDVKALREMRQQLTADVKAGNLDAIQQDRLAVSQQGDMVLADIQA